MSDGRWACDIRSHSALLSLRKHLVALQRAIDRGDTREISSRYRSARRFANEAIRVAYGCAETQRSGGEGLSERDAIRVILRAILDLSRAEEDLAVRGLWNPIQLRRRRTGYRPPVAEGEED